LREQRLPTAKELQTLVDDSVPPPGPTIDSTYFPGTPAGDFWSSTPLAGLSSSAWFVSFSSSAVTNVNLVASTYEVRCVR